MVEKGYEVVWTKRSQKQMRQVFKHISKDSPKNASKVVLEIAEAVLKAKPNPETRINIRPTMMGASGLLRNTDTGLLNGSPKIQSEFDKFTAAKHGLSKGFQQKYHDPSGITSSSLR